MINFKKKSNEFIFRFCKDNFEKNLIIKIKINLDLKKI